MQSTPGAAARVALVHDFLIGVRGAERVFFDICTLYPDADVFSPIYDERGTEGRLSGRRVHTSFLQRLRPGQRTFRKLMPLYPAAMRSFDLTGYDLVISSSSAWAHAVHVDPDATHVCYCHNPFRYAWNERDRTLAERRDPVTRAVLDVLLERWRAWDRQAARRVDRYVTNSGTTQRRILAYLGRDSTVVYPPVETHRFTPGDVGDGYVLLSALMSHKRIGVPVEEFGIAAVEAQAAGRPVIAAGGGGALETVVEGVTGRLWEGGAEELSAAVADFDALAVDPAACVANARRFDAAIFRERFPVEVEQARRGQSQFQPYGSIGAAPNGASADGAGAYPGVRGTRIS